MYQPAQSNLILLPLEVASISFLALGVLEYSARKNVYGFSYAGTPACQILRE